MENKNLEIKLKNIVDITLKKYDYNEKELLQILLEIQKKSGLNYLETETCFEIAQKLNIPLIRVEALITYYDALTIDKKGKYNIGICSGTACSVNGNTEILEWIEDILNIKSGGITDDNKFSLNIVSCFGACDIAPAIRINERTYGNLDKEKLLELIGRIKTEDGLEKSSANKIHDSSKTVSIITSNFNKYDGYDIDDYIKLGGFKGLKNAIDLGFEKAIEEITVSGIKGRGGAQYPTGKKLGQSRAVKNDRKFVVCNADEGEPGTFKDREILKNDPYKVIEGMITVSYLTEASEGIIYLREEYFWMRDKLDNALSKCYEKGYLGDNILNSNHNFDLRIVSGAGSYVCGEGFAMCESLEGKPAIPRSKPPYVKQAGYLQLPTLIINVETLAAVSTVMKEGSKIFTNIGTKNSLGSKVVSISGKVLHPGVYEVPFGISIREIIYDIAGGIKDNKNIGFIQLGGASGGIIPEKLIDSSYDYDTLKKLGVSPGSGAIVVADEDNDVIEYMKIVQGFFAHESCGKCTPCREGNKQLKKILEKFANKSASIEDLNNFKKTIHTLEIASLCGGGKTEAVPFNCILTYFENELLDRIIR